MYYKDRKSFSFWQLPIRQLADAHALRLKCDCTAIATSRGSAIHPATAEEKSNFSLISLLSIYTILLLEKSWHWRNSGIPG